MAYKRIVVATDGSATAETAERVAVALAVATKARLTVANGYTEPERGAAAVARALELAASRGVRSVEPALSPDDPASAVLSVAEERDADLIVIGSVGFAASEQLFGSISRKVVTNAPCDVLLTRARDAWGADDEPPYRRLLIATDGSVTADRAARKGYALAKRLGASVTLVFVGHPKTGELVLQDTVATIGEGSEVPSAIQIRTGDPAREIVDAAATEGFDLVVIGNRGMAGAKATLLGSVPRDIAESSPVDVLVARTIAQSLDEIGPGEGGVVTSGDVKIAVFRDRKGRLTTLSARCTHMGCTVRWNPTETTWDCPCHGSRFAPTGEVVNGPAERPLPPTTL